MQHVSVISRNDDFQMLDSLKTNRHKRTNRRLIFVEGVAVINKLLEASVPVEAVVFSASRELSDWAHSVIDQACPTKCYRLSHELMEELSDRGDPSEMIVVARRPAEALSSIGLVQSKLVVVLDRPANPGNLGSAVRSCDAFGVDVVITTGHAADIWDPIVLRASRGAVFTTPTIHEPSATRVMEWLRSLRAAQPSFRFLGTDSAGRVPIHDPSIQPPLALLFGNEATGLSQALREFVDDVVAVPMFGSVDSLNLACAVSVAIYSVVIRQQ